MDFPMQPINFPNTFWNSIQDTFSFLNVITAQKDAVRNVVCFVVKSKLPVSCFIARYFNQSYVG